jgi:hypothetical protein
MRLSAAFAFISCAFFGGMTFVDADVSSSIMPI